MRFEFISRRVRSAFEDVISERTLREIHTMFLDEGFSPASELDVPIPEIGQRRGLVRRYHANIRFEDRSQAERVLRIYEPILDHLPVEDEDGYPHWRRQRLLRLLEDDGIDTSGRRWRLPDAQAPTILRPLAEIADRLGADTLKRQVELMIAACETDPRLAIGTAKEMIETTCRTILRDRGVDAPRDWEVLDAVKATLEALDLVASDVPDQKRAADSIKRALRTLTTTVQAVAELRNAYGSGHGPEGRSTGLGPRHARLVVGAAATVAEFLFATHQERAAEPAF